MIEAFAPRKSTLANLVVASALMCGLVGCAAAFTDGRSTLLGSGDDQRRSDTGVGNVSENSPASDADKSFSFEDLSPDNVSKTFKQMIGKGPNQAYARERFVEADKGYEQARESRAQNPEGNHRDQFANVATIYREAADRWPDSALEQDALYRSGECYFFADKYPEAEETYELLIKKYENSKYLDVVMAKRFQIAQYWSDYNRQIPHRFLAYNFYDRTRPGLDTGGHALRVWDRMRIDDPTGKLADDATMAAANSHFTSGQYIKADEFYTDLRKSFPSSEHQFKAHLLGLKAKLESYQGAQYSGKALDEAEKLVQQIRKQFPVESQNEREYLDRAFLEVRFRKAEREWLMGQFYDQRSEYRAAQLYYDTLVKEFDDTPFAEKAEARLGEIAGKPPTPPQRLSWLVKMFPEKKDVKPLIMSDDVSTMRR